MYKIYLVQNMENGKVYVGKTSKTLEERWTKHLQCARQGVPYYFYNAIRKYGPSIFVIRLLCSVEEEKYSGDLEKKYILLFQSHRPENGYNSTLGGEGVTPNEETKQKIRISNTGQKRSEEARKNMSIALSGTNSPNYGRRLSEKHKQNIARAHTKNIPLEEIEKLYLSNHNLREIGSMFNVSASAISRRLQKLNVPRRPSCVNNLHGSNRPSANPTV